MDTAQGNWHSLRHSIEKSDVVEHYGDAKFPMQLRMFAELLFGKAIGGSSGAAMLQMMKSMEKSGHIRLIS